MNYFTTGKYKNSHLVLQTWRLQKNYHIDFIGIKIPNKFIVGYGLDYDELGRNLPEIYRLKENRMIDLILFGLREPEKALKHKY